METNELLSMLVNSPNSDYTEDMKEMLAKLAQPFINELNRLREEDDDYGYDIIEATREAFAEAFADELDSREMAKFIKSELIFEHGYFYEMARWHFFFQELKNKRMGYWG